MTVKGSFNATKNRHNYYRERNCVRRLCRKLKDRAMEKINFEEKEMIPLSLMKSKKYAIYAKKSFALMKMKKINLNYTKMSEIIAITLENLEKLLIVFAI